MPTWSTPRSSVQIAARHRSAWVRGATVSAPGTYLLRSHYVPFWEVRGAACVRPAPGGLTYLDISRPGPVTLTVAPTAEAVLLAADGTDTCKPAHRG